MVSANDSTNRSDVNRRDALESVRKKETAPDRRGFLRGAVASVAAALGFSGTAAAIDTTGEYELRKLQRQYKPMARQAAHDHGGELLELLAEHGYLTDGSIEEFDRFGVSAWHVGDTATARIDGRLELADRQLSVSIEPETGRSYAVDDAGDGWTLLKVGVDGSLESRDVTTQGTVCLTNSLNCSYCEEHDYSCEDDGCHVAPTGTCCSDCQSSCGC